MNNFHATFKKQDGSTVTISIESSGVDNWDITQVFNINLNGNHLKATQPVLYELLKGLRNESKQSYIHMPLWIMNCLKEDSE